MSFITTLSGPNFTALPYLGQISICSICSIWRQLGLQLQLQLLHMPDLHLQLHPHLQSPPTQVTASQSPWTQAVCRTPQRGCDTLSAVRWTQCRSPHHLGTPSSCHLVTPSSSHPTHVTLWWTLQNYARKFLPMLTLRCTALQWTAPHPCHLPPVLSYWCWKRTL